MDGPWNLWDIKPPPICTVKTILHFKEMTDMNEVTFHALKTLENLKYLNKEAAILSRFLYKYQRIYRHDKGMQNLVKVYQCLKKYLKLDMLGVLQTFKQSLPFKFPSEATHAYLPTRQMLKWVLLRFQAFTQIFVRLTNLTKEVGAYFLAKSWLGWNLQPSLMIFSISARILTTSKYLVKKSIEWYNTLYKYLPFLEQTSEFLPDYNLPTNLHTWLGPVDLAPLKKKTFIDEIFEVIDLAKDDEQDEDGEVTVLHMKLMKSFFKTKVSNVDSDVEEVILEETENEKKGMKRPLEIHQYQDVGVPVNINEEALERPRKNKKNKIGKRTKWLKKVKKTLKNFDNHEENKNFGGFRKKSGDSCITID